jgi:hypothetical protein
MYCKRQFKPSTEAQRKRRPPCTFPHERLGRCPTLAATSSSPPSPSPRRHWSELPGDLWLARRIGPLWPRMPGSVIRVDDGRQQPSLPDFSSLPSARGTQQIQLCTQQRTLGEILVGKAGFAECPFSRTRYKSFAECPKCTRPKKK